MTGPETKPQPKLMSMERACARKWLEANPPCVLLASTGAEFEQTVEALALHIFHYMNGFDDSEAK
jgi:hypothetical protein